jgi:hypothetical protein
MAYRLAGTYVAHCDCTQLCACSVDEKPTGRDGHCHGLIVYGVRDGSLDSTDVSGVNVVLSYYSPSNLSAGDLRLGLVVDEGASDEQAQALERIFSGKEGGVFEQFASLTGEWLGVERASVSFSDGDEPSAKIGDTDVNFEAFRDADGNLTKERNALFGFAPEFTLGKSSGTSGLFGESFDASYGESAEFEYTS